MPAIRPFRFLRQLLDVNTAGVADGDVLVYDEGTATWVPGAGGGGASALADLSDVTGGPAAAGEAPVWDGDSFELTNVATQSELDAHLNDTSAAHAASAISADSTTLVGVGTDVQAVLEELDNGIADHLADTSAAHAASAIAFTPAGTIAATDVQAAIEEVSGDVGSIPNDYVAKATYDANTILKADTDNTPAALTMGASTILARLAAGSIVAATPSEIRTLLGLVIGTNVQAYDADLTTYAGISPSANVQSLLGAADYAAIRTLLALVIGTNVQAWDADLDAIAALSPTNDDIIQRKAGAWVNRTIAQLRDDLRPGAPAISGQWYVRSNSLTATGAGIQSKLYAQRVLLNAGTLDRIAAQHWANAGAGETERLGIYADSNGRPGALLVDAGTIDLSTATGFKTKTINLPITAGWYWLAGVHQGGTTSTLVTFGDSSGQYASTESWQPSDGVNIHSTSAVSAELTGVTGTLPDPFGAATMAVMSGVQPMVAVRYA